MKYLAVILAIVLSTGLLYTNEIPKKKSIKPLFNCSIIDDFSDYKMAWLRTAIYNLVFFTFFW